MIKVGVTGGIGSGKTTFCKVWEKLGAYVVYADDLAKELMVNENELISQIKAVFGKNSYHSDGTLNRRHLAEEAFAKGRVKELNAIVHPVLWARLNELADQKKREGVKVFVEEAAILMQHGRPENLDTVILLLAEDAKRVQRVKSRDSLEEQAITERINKQEDFNKMAHLADYVVKNDSSVSELVYQADQLFNKIISQN